MRRNLYWKTRLKFNLSTRCEPAQPYDIVGFVDIGAEDIWTVIRNRPYPNQFFPNYLLLC